MRVAIGMGSNLGHRQATLTAACAALEHVPGIVPIALSSVYETPPWGPPQPDYLNAVLLVEAKLEPGELLSALHGVEAALGRKRAVRFGPRTLDLDILHAAGWILKSPRLTIPHPRLVDRPFALVPLVEVWPEAKHPESGRPYAAILEELGSATEVGPPRPLPRCVPKRQLDHTADLRLEVRAKNLEALFVGAAMAVVDTMVDRGRVAERERRVLRASVPEGSDPAELMVAALEELVFLQDAKRFLPRRVVLLTLRPTGVELAVHGQRMKDTSQVRTHIKAVTYHGASIEQKARGHNLRARFVLDV